jgi:hypothetical protein
MAKTATQRAFIQNCEDILARQSDVTINDQALADFAKTLKASSFVPDWKEYISSAANDPAGYDFKRAFYEMAMVVANQGGFIYEDAAGDAQKWHVNGSGARAMVEKMAEIRGAGALPFYDIPAAAVESKIRPLLQGVPFADERIGMFKAFADPVRHQAVMDLLDQAYDGEKYVFDMPFAEKLSQIMPEGFGNDPFFKKSILTALMASGNGHHHGIKADVSDMTVAADYILPQVLNADHIGVLSFSPALTQKLEQRALFKENAAEVTVLRAAAVVACDRLAQLSGLSAQDIDGNLWMAGRKLQNARPHMMCITTQF